MVVTLWKDRMVPIGSPDFPKDDRLELRVSSIAAADISRMHASDEGIEIPWYDSPFS